MNRNTVKPALTHKRAKQSTENSEFDAFARRILRAYGRRVAAGDVEALRSLSQLAAELDAVTRIAVTGLHSGVYRYSWQEIADRLGVSRQAVQMRYGERTERGALDRRLIEAGLCVTVAILVEVFADHHPGVPAGSVCPGCGYRYPDKVTDCPTNATVRPILARRSSEDHKALDRLTSDQLADLRNKTTARTNRVAASRAARPAPSSDRHASLLDLIDGKDQTP
jgi:DNA-binding Lrp family transcriptional regulator